MYYNHIMLMKAPASLSVFVCLYVICILSEVLVLNVAQTQAQATTAPNEVYVFLNYRQVYSLQVEGVIPDELWSLNFLTNLKLVGDKRRQEGNVVLWNVMIDWYVRIGNFRASRNLFDKMPQRSVVSWNAMISGYAQNGKFKEAIEMFHEMQMGDVRPNYVTLVSVLPPISRLGALELGKWVHSYSKEWVEEREAAVGERDGFGIK
ncbi:hypothetical protein Pint_06950 [Pistacia integerrima]|uniref:Uncharacterized protein n=1 Tax=Pistacia integerrima TaxID=434235 RepID=A0ACC0XWB2_9ROSI|nr:hypothetical protein Pint_06950 [Pistacia integerrima]